MNTLEKSLRGILEKTIIEARSASEETAKIVLEQLGVGEKVSFIHLSEEDRKLRNKLRSHGHQLGDKQFDDKSQSIDNLLEEVAYQHWHRMLFARFLAENNLLMDDDPDSPIPMSLDECNDLASSMGASNGWELAARFASNMLPQIFQQDSPIFSLQFPIERQKVLEQLVAGIPLEVFKASDSLGWVYQFWQTKRKEDINKSGVKIGARELPAVTQLFTEPYMVSFLLDNSLGAWWASRRLSNHDLSSAKDEQELRDKVSLSGMPLEYLRFVKEDDVWFPASGTFDAWPEDLSEFKMLDPSCGSGHFLVATFEMLVPMRMKVEGLSADEAIEKVLKENIYGLELDQRCVELAAFALAFAAWTYPGSSGYQSLPALHIACSGQAINIEDDKLRVLANGNHDLYNTLVELKEKFEQAPVLGSLINPKGTLNKGELFSLNWEEVGPLLDKILRKGIDDDIDEAAIVAQGLAKAASLLAGSYHLVATNVPYLGRGKQGEELRQYCDKYHKEAKTNLATVFMERCLQLCPQGGTTSIVLIQDWLFLTSYEDFRKKMLTQETWHILARLGENGFDSPAAAGAFTALISISRGLLNETNTISSIDVSEPKTVEAKAQGLVGQEIKRIGQKKQLDNPDARVSLDSSSNNNLLEELVIANQGIKTGDDFRWRCFMWEITEIRGGWKFYQSTVNSSQLYGGRAQIIDWRYEGLGMPCRRPTNQNFTKKGIAISQMRKLPPTLYTGELYDSNVGPISPYNVCYIPSIWCFCSSLEYNAEVRLVDQSLKVTNATLVKVPFDLERWTKVAQEQYPNGLPLPFTDDPTQWIFHGHPCGSVVWDEEAKWTASASVRSDSTVLHVAVARLLGYRWPAELDEKMELAGEQRALVSKCEELLSYSDNDGIVCIPPVGGEFSANDRLLRLLRASYGNDWTDSTLSELLSSSDAAGRKLEYWLRDKFFIQHTKLFGDRPFIWQVWDGLPDGFSALVNYHKMDYKKLETLIYTYLGDWIQRQKSDVANNVEGAREKLSAATALSQRLELILKGEPPYDIFVRWKSLEEQPIGWNPDLNDGVRLNIRPFMSVADVGKRDAGVLRDKPNVKWGKDRGQDVESAPWYNLGPIYGGKKGDRINDHHLTLQEKIEAQEPGAHR